MHSLRETALHGFYKETPRALHINPFHTEAEGG